MWQRIKAFFSPDNRRLHISIVSLIFLLAFLACGITNIVIERRLSWSLIVLGALLFAWCAIFMLLYMKKHSWLWALGAICALSIPLLFWIEFTGPVKGWVMPLGLPVAGISIAYIAAVLALFHFIPIKKSYKISISIALVIPLSILTNSLTCRFTGQPFQVLQNMASALILLCSALVFFVLGFMGKGRKPDVHGVKQAGE